LMTSPVGLPNTSREGRKGACNSFEINDIVRLAPFFLHNALAFPEKSA